MSALESCRIDMKRLRYILLVLAILLTTAVSAQSYLVKRTVGAVEGEIGVGLATAANKLSQFGETRQGVDAHVEVRYNFHQKPFDIGLHFGISSFRRGRYHQQGAALYKFDSQHLMAVSDYNFFQGRLVSVFMGVGVGAAWSGTIADGSGKGFNFCAMPRVGIELQNVVRIYASYKAYERANNHLVVGVGFVIGGRRR